MRAFSAILLTAILSWLAARGLVRLDRDRFASLGAPARTAHGPARRAIALTPALAEIVFALGAGDRLVGVSDFSRWPPEAAQVPSCGGAFNPNLERIVALEPDLILIQGIHGKVRDLARVRGVRLLRVDLERLDDLWAAIRAIGGAFGLEARARDLERSLTARFEAIRRATRGKPPPRTLLVAGRMPGGLGALTAIGRSSFLADLLAIAGGRNVFGDVGARYPQVSREALIRRAPEVIIELRPSEGPPDDLRARVRAAWAGLRSIPAVRAGRIHVLTGPYVLLPGPRVVRTAGDMARVLHPDAFGDREDGQGDRAHGPAPEGAR